MSSKKEEKAAFEKLKKAFPGHNVSLENSLRSWYNEHYYQAYDAGVGPGDGEFGKGKTANEAVENLINKRKEELDNKQAEKESL